MPAVLAAFVEYIADYLVVDYAVAYAVADAIVEVIAVTAFDLALNAALSKSESSSSNTPGQSANLEINYFSTEAPLRLVFGYIKAGGMETIPPITTGANGEDIHKILSLAGHEIDSICDVLVDTDRILSPDIGALTGTLSDGVFNTANSASPSYKYNGWGSARRYVGTSAQTVDWILNNLVSPTTFTSDFRGRGIAYVALSFRFNQKVWRSVPQVTIEMNGAKVYDPRLDSTQSGGSGSHRYATPSTWEFSVTPFLQLAYYLMSSLGGSYDPATEIDWPSFVTAANVCDAIVDCPVPFSTFVHTNYSQSGTTFVRTSGNLNWTDGVYSTDGTVKGSVSAVGAVGVNAQNFGLHTSAAYASQACAYSWTIHSDVGEAYISEGGAVVYETHILPTLNTVFTIDYDGTYVHYLMNGRKCWSTLVLVAGMTLYFNCSSYYNGIGIAAGKQRRYTSNGTLFAATSPEQFISNVKDLMGAGLGRVIYTNGKWSAFAGGWQTPTFSIPKTAWVSPLSIKLDNGLNGRFNRMHCWFIDRMRNWQRMECQPRYNPTYAAADGRDIDREFDQVLCTDEYEAQRKAEFLLDASRNQIALVGRLPPAWQDLSMWDTGTVVFDDLGWVSKTFRIVSNAINTNGTYDVSVQEEQSTDWTDLTAAEYNTQSHRPLPAINQTTPSAPQSFAITPHVLFLDMVWTDPVIKPLGTQFRIMQGAVNSYGGAAEIWRGEALKTAIPIRDAVPRYYWVDATVNSSFSTFPGVNSGVVGTAYPSGNIASTHPAASAGGYNTYPNTYFDLAIGYDGSNTLITAGGASLVNIGPYEKDTVATMASLVTCRANASTGMSLVPFLRNNTDNTLTVGTPTNIGSAYASFSINATWTLTQSKNYNAGVVRICTSTIGFFPSDPTGIDVTVIR